MSLIFRLELATRCKTWQSLHINRSGGRVRPPLRNLVVGIAVTPVSRGQQPQLRNYEDLYLTEHPYGLVCGVETDLPAND